MTRTLRPPWRLALAQMRVDPGDPAANLARAEDWIGWAAGEGARVVLLPEALDCGWTHPSARSAAGPIPGGEACERLRGAARAHGVHVCAGLVERDGERLYNAAVFVDPEGRVRLHHRKIHELDFARALYSLGDRLGVVDTELGRIGLMICADGLAPGGVIARTLAHMGAQVILSPCAWAVPSDHDEKEEPYGQLWCDHYGPVARDFGVGIFGCSHVGPIVAGEWAGWNVIGCSLAVGGMGQVMRRGPYAEEALLVMDMVLPAATEGRGDEDVSAGAR